MRRCAIPLFLTFLSVTTFAQNNTGVPSKRDSIESIKSVMRQTGKVTTMGIGPAALPSRQYSRFLFLLSCCNEYELYELATDTSANLRVYGLIGLLYLKSKRAKEIKAMLLQDNTISKVHYGCISDSWQIKKTVKELKYWYSKSHDVSIKNYLSRTQSFFTYAQLLESGN